MKITSEELSRVIQEYIDDSYSFGDEDPNLIENVLKSISTLNETEGGMSKERLSELAENSEGEPKNIINDFILYLENS